MTDTVIHGLARQLRDAIPNLVAQVEANGRRIRFDERRLTAVPAPGEAFRGVSRRRSSDMESQVSVGITPDGLPVAGPISSGFGMRMHPVEHRLKPHEGIDIAAPEGAPVAATADGVVTFVGSRTGYGTTVEIRHADGSMSRYAHLSATAVAAGASVTAGSHIGNVGKTGNAKGAHLHYEVRVESGTAVDPRVRTTRRAATTSRAGANG